MKLDYNKQDQSKAIERELGSLLRLRPCLNLVCFKGVSLSEDDHMCLITEFCAGGNLFELLHRNINLKINLKQKIKFIKDIAIGINFLHSSNPPLIHRDLKSLK